LLLALGINKQLDLQSALTEAARTLAHIQGWYHQRGIVQLSFVLLVALCLVCAIVLIGWTRQAPGATRLALLGAVLLLGFVVSRVASFHHLDRFINERFLGLRWS
jgi:Flp pilus assembly protein TadB